MKLVFKQIIGEVKEITLNILTHIFVSGNLQGRQKEEFILTKGVFIQPLRTGTLPFRNKQKVVYRFTVGWQWKNQLPPHLLQSIDMKHMMLPGEPPLHIAKMKSIEFGNL